jgi:TRAP-type C4-dicarboxylate transport system permease small subunit
MGIRSAVTAASVGLEKVALACRFAGMFFLAAMTVLVVLQIVGRNVFDLGLPWADELARTSTVALVFLCVPLLALKGQLVSVDLVPLLLPEGLRRWAGLLADVAVLAFCVLTLIGFESFLSRAGKFTTPATGMTNWVFYAPALIGFVLLALVSLVRILIVLTGADRSGRQP